MEIHQVVKHNVVVFKIFLSLTFSLNQLENHFVLLGKKNVSY